MKSSTFSSTPPLLAGTPGLALASASILALTLAFTLAGCAHVTPDTDPLARRELAGANTDLASDIRLASEGWPAARWWTAYHDAQLTALIDQALAGAPTLDVAAARIGTSRAAVSSRAADLGLDLSAYATANRQRYSGTGLFPAPIGGAYFSEQTVRIDARYNFDWWGKNRAQIAAAVGQVNADRATYAQAEQALAAAVAQSYFRLQGGWARIATLDQMIAVQTTLVQDRAKRIANGLAEQDARSAADMELSLLNKERARLDADARGEREALRALLGAGADSAVLAGLAPQPLNATAHALPARLGVELLARRPDLQAARWRVEASLSRIDAARAAFYPDVNLTASIGLDTISIERLLEGPSRTLFVGPTVTLPLFDSKRLNAQLGSARTNRNELIADYNQAVVQAVRDVAQDGVTLQGIERQLAQQRDATASSDAQLRAARARMERGLAERGSVLNAQLALLRRQDETLQLTQMELLAEVALTQSLGGGYRNDPGQTVAASAGPAPAPATKQ